MGPKKFQFFVFETWPRIQMCYEVRCIKVVRKQLQLKNQKQKFKINYSVGTMDLSYFP